MSVPVKHSFKLPPEQQAIRAKCYHPSGAFVDFPIEEVQTSVPTRFEKIVRMYPDRLAVKSEDRTLTYAELNAQANRIARNIVSHGTGLAAPLAILLEKDLAAVAAIIGAFKSARIHVALDPSSPADRIAEIVSDAECKLILTNNRHISLAESLLNTGSALLNLDELDERVSGENLNFQIGPDCPANVIYTSGSTGQAKGVLHDHRHVLYYSMVYTNSHHTSLEDRLSCLYPIGVAGIMRDLLQALLNGASIWLYDVRARGFHGLADWIMDEKISIYRSVPTVFRNFAGTLSGQESFSHVRVVHLAGEHVRRTDVDLWRNHFSPHCVFVTGLGITEAGKVTDYFIDRESLVVDSVVPTGYPVDNMQVFLVGDEKLSSVQVGEIAVKSSYLPPGYWRRPELSNAKYLNDSSGDRVYLTGDMGRRMPDGLLIHLGRKDSMVKIRGYQVEIGEVERTLMSHPNINDAVVLAQWREPGEAFLVGYYVSPRPSGLTVSELRTFLRRTIPDHMIPTALIRMESLPLTANGKIDRQRLPEPDHKRPALNAAFVEARDEIEQRLVQVWVEVLGVDQIGIHDNFFDLGGNSIAATRVISRIIQRFRLAIPLPALFQTPTVAEMATVIKENQAKKLPEKELEQILAALESMSDDEAQKHLGEIRVLGLKNE